MNTYLAPKLKTRSEIRRLRKDLLAHYDKTGRSLPWRIRPEDRARGVMADPYAVWLSEIMLQQTTVAHATPYWETFLERFPTVTDLANAQRDRVLAMWAGLGYYARARNLHKCAGLVRDEYGGVFPQTEAGLLKLPGIGLYTAATIAAICFDAPTNIVDGNVERVISRLFALEAPLPKGRKELRRLAGSLCAPDLGPKRPGDYGQALMDLGANLCTPRAPQCPACPWNWGCAAYKAGNPTDYPRKLKKAKLPIRRGYIFVTRTPTHIWLERRPDKGLLGGMMGFPGSPWIDEGEIEVGGIEGGVEPEAMLKHAPIKRNWEPMVLEVRHMFTHFDLRLKVFKTVLPERVDMGELSGLWAAVSDIESYALPTVMKKVFQAALLEKDSRI